MESIPNLPSPLPAKDSVPIGLKGLTAFKQEADELLAMTEEAAVTPPNLGNKVDLKA